VPVCKLVQTCAVCMMCPWGTALHCGPTPAFLACSSHIYSSQTRSLAVVCCRDMLERTLAAKGMLGQGPALAVARAASDASTSGAANSGGAGRPGGTSPPPDTPTAHLGGPSRTISDVGTPMSHATGYSSMAAEVGSLEGSSPSLNTLPPIEQQQSR
jgi:hypothetical protein